MPTDVHVTALCGSLRDQSYSRASLRIALDAAEERDATTDLIDLRDLDLPPFDAADDDAGDAQELRNRVHRAGSILLGTPMYHGSYSAPLKNALDYCGFDEFEDETVGLLAVAGGGFPVSALEHLRTVCRALNAWVLPHQVAVPHAHRQFEEGRLVDEKLHERVTTLGTRAVEFANIEPDPASFEGEENVGAR
jgi:NAD(P)H-dependent FMN reductase